MKMLRWTCGVTRLDKIRKEKIRGTTKVGEISKKVQERRMRWYGHVMRRYEYVGKTVMGIEVQGSRRARPKKRWADCVKDDLREKGLSGGVRPSCTEATIVPHRPQIHRLWKLTAKIKWFRNIICITEINKTRCNCTSIDYIDNYTLTALTTMITLSHSQ